MSDISEESPPSEEDFLSPPRLRSGKVRVFQHIPPVVLTEDQLFQQMLLGYVFEQIDTLCPLRVVELDASIPTPAITDIPMLSLLNNDDIMQIIKTYSTAELTTIEENVIDIIDDLHASDPESRQFYINIFKAALEAKRTKLASISSPTPPPSTPRIRRNLMHGYTLPPSIPSPSVVVPIPVSSPSLLVSLPVPVTLSGSNVTGFLTVDGIISPIVPHRRVCQLDPGLLDLARKNQTIRADQILIRVLEKSGYMVLEENYCIPWMFRHAISQRMNSLVLIFLFVWNIVIK